MIAGTAFHGDCGRFRCHAELQVTWPLTDLYDVVGKEGCDELFLPVKHASKPDHAEDVVDHRKIKNTIHWACKAERPLCRPRQGHLYYLRKESFFAGKPLKHAFYEHCEGAEKPLTYHRQISPNLQRGINNSKWVHRKSVVARILMTNWD